MKAVTSISIFQRSHSRVQPLHSKSSDEYEFARSDTVYSKVLLIIQVVVVFVQGMMMMMLNAMNGITMLNEIPREKMLEEKC